MKGVLLTLMPQLKHQQENASQSTVNTKVCSQISEIICKGIPQTKYQQVLKTKAKSISIILWYFPQPSWKEIKFDANILIIFEHF
jgi:hypothetical protein